MKLELFFPVKNPCTITQRFGENLNTFYAQIGMKGHNGIDMVGQLGQIFRAAHDGVVTFAGEDGSGGYGIVVRTLDQRDYNGGQAYFKTIFWHILSGSILVTAGQKVSVGDPLAKCDTTGMATGPHLHFGLKPVAQGENDWTWSNIEQNNGFGGAIPPDNYWAKSPSGSYLYAEDFARWQAQLKIIALKIAELTRAILLLKK